VNTQSKDRKSRAKPLRFRTLLLFLTLLSLGLILFASTLGGRFGAFHQVTLEVLGPMQGTVSKVSGVVSRWWDSYIGLVHVRQENVRLKTLLVAYEEELAKYRESYATYLRLQEELSFRQATDFPPLTARVIGRDPAFWFHTIIVDRGETDGVMEGMVALTSQGIVGQVIQVSSHYSKILLAIAPSSAIDVLIQKNRVRGILKGAGQDGYVLHYVLKNADIARGDQVVTAGIGGLFASGVPVGVVTDVQRQKRGMFLEIAVQPSVDFQRLEFVQLNLSLQQSVSPERIVSGGR
jgi:rod shape-determining protein MreC